MHAVQGRSADEIPGMQAPTVTHCELNSAQPCVSWPASICKEHTGAVAHGHEGADRTLRGCLHIATAGELADMRDEELRRYIRQVEYRSELALAELEKAEDYFGAKGWLDRLDAARAAAYAEAGRRPHVWAAIEAVIDARAAEATA